MNYKLGNAGGDGIGSERAVTGGNDDGFGARILGGTPNGSEYGSGLDLPLLQYASSIGIFVPVPSVTGHIHTTSSFKPFAKSKLFLRFPVVRDSVAGRAH